MLAGLLFAVHDAEDRSDALAATLPFAGATLIEYQARLLVGAGASQIVVAVSRLTPELLGALARIGRRGVAVDPVRTAAEAAEKLHPLARVLVLEDGLVTTEPVIRLLTEGSGDALLVTAAREARPGAERLGGELAWAGAARVAAARVSEVAVLPRDYDLQSALLRVAAQAGAARVPVPADGAAGHGVERRAGPLELRNRAVIAAVAAEGGTWFDRIVLAPIARAVLPVLVRRGTPSAALLGASLAVGVTGLAAVTRGWGGTGAVFALAGTIAAALGRVLARLRDERLARAGGVLAALIPACAVLAIGLRSGGASVAAAVALVSTAGLGERAAGERRRIGWGGPPAYLLLVAAGALAGAPFLGIGASWAYAAATAFAAVEALRRRA